MKALRYTITLEEPLLATSLQGEPNSSISLDYIPGSFVRGALIARYLQGKGAAYDLPHDLDARRLFLDGRTRYLSAYPLVNGQRLLPTPRCLAAGKQVDLREAGQQIRNLTSLQDFESRWGYEEQHGALKPLSAPFCHITDGYILLHRPERTIAIHVQRDRNVGKATRASGTIFRYDALAAGQVFQGIILLDTDSDATTLTSLLPTEQPLWLGRSRSAHYGRVRLTVATEDHQWSEWDDAVAELATNTELSDEPHLLLFLSDAILPDTNGQPTTSLTDATLAQALGIPAGSLTIVREQSHISSTIHGGYNAAARLPLPQQPAIAAGSVVAFRLTTSMDAATLTRLHQQGIGLRRAEGFGRVALVEELKDTYTICTVSSSRGTSPRLSDEEQALARVLAGRLARHRRETALREFVQHYQFQQLPRRSQLNELRTLARGTSEQTPAQALQAIQQRLQEMKQTARQQFEQARIKREGENSDTLENWINTLISNAARQQQLARQVGPTSTSVSVAGQQPPDADHQQFALDLLAAVLEKAAKQKGEPTQ